MPKKIIPGSGNQTLVPQQVFVADRGREMPHVADIAVALFMKQFRSPGTYLLGCDPAMYTRCSETVQFERGAPSPLIVGNFSPAGLYVSSNSLEYEFFGVTGIAEVQGIDP